ncbi:GNAT family N-acetyltransferase [Romeria aff. gracilis LEGE 07310]|uniref:GNAT family N-acetyltransferase n=1 Tax=Vasconcelosia minhoensis LEGE 07310 TaxID=915328 RepID=A0A8J7AJD4_9CYAN|nr:GNAT family N-acetyltransferase [Romeria gracilis]MBE9075714.1 GNAT family N-acetyltransferase [Romeria aff. gracilis LEGE 07310]
MSLIFRPLESEQALAILCWRYPSPYDCYNFDVNNTKGDLLYLLDPNNAFYAILNLHGALEGYCSFGIDGQVPGGDYSTEALDIGMGIRPDLVGLGRGKHYAQAIARYGVCQHGAQVLRVTIAAFNQRAQQVWKQLGFEQVDQFVKIGSKERFVVMVCAGTQWLAD